MTTGRTKSPHTHSSKDTLVRRKNTASAHTHAPHSHLHVTWLKVGHMGHDDDSDYFLWEKTFVASLDDHLTPFPHV